MTIKRFPTKKKTFCKFSQKVSLSFIYCALYYCVLNTAKAYFACSICLKIPSSASEGYSESFP